MEFVVFFLMAAGIAVAAKLMGRFAKRTQEERTVTVEGVSIGVRVGAEVEMGSGTVLRTTAVAGPKFQLLVAHDRSRLFAAVEPQQRIDIRDPGFEGTLRVWSNDVAIARWWMTPRALRERMLATAPRWGFKIDDGLIEARSPQMEDPTLDHALAAMAALAVRGAALESELQAARAVLVGTGLSVRLDLVRERHGTFMVRIDTRTRFFAQRSGSEPFSLERHLVGETKRLYDEVAPASVDADDLNVHVDVDGVVLDPDVILRSARLAARLAEPMVQTLDEGPYR